MNLYQKIIEVRKTIDVLSKDTEGYGYTYVSGNQILSKVKDKMNEIGLLLIPEAIPGPLQPIDRHHYRSANGNDKTDFIVNGMMRYVWIDAESGERLEIPWAYYGQQDDISKAYGSALTYSERYFWLKQMGIPTDSDDPDAMNTRDKTSITSKKSEPATYNNAKKVFDKGSSKTITVPQQKRLKAMAGFDDEIIEQVLKANGVNDIADLVMGAQYDKACTEAGLLKADQEIQGDVNDDPNE